MQNFRPSDGVPVLGFIVGKMLEALGKMTISDWVMFATLVFTIFKIIPAARDAWRVVFGKDKTDEKNNRP